MSKTFITQRRVEFRDTDAAGIVHFSVFFAYMEQAEHEMLRQLGLSVVADIDGRQVSWPRVRASCDFRNAIRFEELVDIRVNVHRIGTTSVTYHFQFCRGSQPIAEGSITAVCCEVEPARRPQPIEIPQPFIDALMPYLAPPEKNPRTKQQKS